MAAKMNPNRDTQATDAFPTFDVSHTLRGKVGAIVVAVASAAAPMAATTGSLALSACGGGSNPHNEFVPNPNIDTPVYTLNLSDPQYLISGMPVPGTSGLIIVQFAAKNADHLEQGVQPLGTAVSNSAGGGRFSIANQNLRIVAMNALGEEVELPAGAVMPFGTPEQTAFSINVNQIPAGTVALLILDGAVKVFSPVDEADTGFTKIRVDMSLGAALLALPYNGAPTQLVPQADGTQLVNHN